MNELKNYLESIGTPWTHVAPWDIDDEQVDEAIWIGDDGDIVAVRYKNGSYNVGLDVNDNGIVIVCSNEKEAIAAINKNLSHVGQ